MAIRYSGNDELSDILAGVDDHRITVNGECVVIQDPNKVRADGSGKRLDQLNWATEAFPIKKTGTSKARQVDDLLNQLTRLSAEKDSMGNPVVYNRRWLAQQVSAKPNDLNAALKSNTPAGLHNNVANRAIGLLKRKVKTLEKKQSK